MTPIRSNRETLTTLGAAFPLAGAAALASFLVSSGASEAGHPKGSSEEYGAPIQAGNCLGSHGYFLCYDSYSHYIGPGYNFPLKIWSRRDTRVPSFFDPLIQQAESDWEALDGPQEFSTSPPTNPRIDLWYHSDTPSPLNGIRPNGGMQLSCHSMLPDECIDHAEARSYEWSEIWLDDYFLPDSDWANHPLHLVSHEIGHALLLTHHDVGLCGPPQNPGCADNWPLMERVFSTDVPFWAPFPGSTEIGNSAPPCHDLPLTSYASFGILCIYDWYPNATATPVPTNTPYPSGTPANASNSGSAGCMEQHRWKC